MPCAMLAKENTKESIMFRSCTIGLVAAFTILSAAQASDLSTVNLKVSGGNPAIPDIPLMP